MKNKEFLSIAELAKIMGISRISVFKKVKSGEIPSIKIGRSYAIDREDIPALSGKTSKKKALVIEEAVKKTVREYGEVLRRLGQE
ncbi:MAG: helix-turn-helix domain-containing protein [bacterium]